MDSEKILDSSLRRIIRIGQQQPVKIPTVVDQGYREFLKRRAPTEKVRKYLKEGLTNGPMKYGASHAVQYFGAAQVQAIGMRCAPLLEKLELECPKLIAWLNVTGFANDYRMLKAFSEWAIAEPAARPLETTVSVTYPPHMLPKAAPGEEAEVVVVPPGRNG